MTQQDKHEQHPAGTMRGGVVVDQEEAIDTYLQGLLSDPGLFDESEPVPTLHSRTAARLAALAGLSAPPSPVGSADFRPLVTRLEPVAEMPVQEAGEDELVAYGEGCFVDLSETGPERLSAPDLPEAGPVVLPAVPSPAAEAPAAPGVTGDVVFSDSDFLAEPTVEEPTVEEPTVEEPTVEEPTVEEPTVEEPTVEILPTPLPLDIDVPVGEVHLLLRVGGLRLALPAERIAAVLPEQTEVRTFPRQPDWVLGAVSALGRQSLVMRLDAVVLGHPQGAPARVVLMDGGRWGLACDAVEEERALDPSTVVWREAGSGRAWLAGTARAERLAVLDVDGLRRMFQQA
ncbi:MAG: chemotaxis protein CheW [Halothiobacillaceae bacterium]|nr:chemotaxis protein CheW [Halothiobacillaceae bacterium]